MPPPRAISASASRPCPWPAPICLTGCCGGGLQFFGAGLDGLALGFQGARRRRTSRKGWGSCAGTQAGDDGCRGPLRSRLMSSMMSCVGICSSGRRGWRAAGGRRVQDREAARRPWTCPAQAHGQRECTCSSTPSRLRTAGGAQAQAVDHGCTSTSGAEARPSGRHGRPSKPPWR